MLNYTGNRYAYAGMNLPISSANINGTGLMLAQRVKYTAKTSIAIISTANRYLDGTGAVSTLITAGNGTLLKRIIIKAQGTTTQGMVRFFLKVSSSYWLIREVEIPAVVQSSKDQTLIAVIDEPFYLKSSYTIVVSTENAETFIVSVEGMELAYP